MASVKNSFRINVIFIVLAIVGMALASQLTVQLQPTRESNQVVVSYRWRGVSAEIIEREVTSSIEGVLSTMDGLKDISSNSSKGEGRIRLTFKKEVNIDVVRFELSSILRTLYPKLPDGVTRPVIGGSYQRNDTRIRLMTFTVHGTKSKDALGKYAEDYLVSSLGEIDEVESVEVDGVTPLEWCVEYDTGRLHQYGMTTRNVANAMYLYFNKEELGLFKWLDQQESSWHAFSYCGGSFHHDDTIAWDKIIIGTVKDHIVRLGEVAKVKVRHTPPSRYFRLNGLNTIYLNIYSSEGANQIELGAEVLEKVEIIEKSLPKSVSLDLSYDASKSLREERDKILFRSSLALLILLLFVWVISRDWRYLLVITVSLLVNLAIAVIGYLFFDVQIHLYSLAGITVSLGIIIDNTIVMADYCKRQSNENIFWAILAATLTTIGSLSVIFFLKENQRMNLVDFSWVMIINLIVSLLIAYFFIPALMDKVPMKKRDAVKAQRGLRRVIKVSRVYERFILWGCRYRKSMITLSILVFGIPFFSIPSHLGKPESRWGRDKVERTWFEDRYNKSIGSNFFQQDILPWFNRIGGGVLYRFSQYFETHAGRQEPKVMLRMQAMMPDGATLDQMNNSFLKIERRLSQYSEIDRFVSHIYSANYGFMEIHFKEEEQSGAFPMFLKSELIQIATETGSLDARIYGVDPQGFNNHISERNLNQSISLVGTSYPVLMKIGNNIKKELQKSIRVKEVVVHANKQRIRDKKFEYVVDVDLKKLAKYQLTLGELYYLLSQHNWAIQNLPPVGNGDSFRSMVLRPKLVEAVPIWDIQNMLLDGIFKKGVRLKDVARVRKEFTSGSIEKRNQEYVMRVDYEFIGDRSFSEMYREKIVDEISEQLPTGYRVEESSNRRWRWNAKDKKQYGLLFLVAVIIYFICAVLLESLIQPLVIITMIPLSFIGIFSIFTITEYPFNQGGYASMILLSGITVNTALFIVYDFNHLRDSSNRNALDSYLHAFHKKVIPILLTVVSTVLGMVPFLIDSQDKGFWFALALGAMGGLLFSLIAVFVSLPIFMNVGKKEKA
ncbi:efflux RND transporter permease subunit [Halosquirtibacter xylanolyticus]|uniref:efflux RND transporter permease subunit n=1 Tax=Halosquirtibacter xylanolyticus TaxID=3374599 RepID=UPI0037486632|nr:efflux RND transporter permease subunit [Prolixibacteraceae bacterium]